MTTFILAPRYMHVLFDTHVDASPIMARRHEAYQAAAGILMETGHTLCIFPLGSNEDEQIGAMKTFSEATPPNLVALLPIPGWSKSRYVEAALELFELCETPFVVLDLQTYVGKELLEQMKEDTAFLLRCESEINKANSEKEMENVKAQTQAG